MRIGYGVVMKESASGPRGRTYDSSGRRKSAEEKRGVIVEAARQLFAQKGYEATTIDAIAEAASVSAPTVYAAFSSKAGILKAILHKARFNADYDAAVAAGMDETDVYKRFPHIAALVRSIYEGERREMEFLTGSGLVAPELAAIQNEQEEQRRERQKYNIELLMRQGALKAGLDEKTARDILWMLTSREVFRMFTVDCGWDADRYERWLADALLGALAKPQQER